MVWKKIQWSDDIGIIAVRKNSGYNIGIRQRLNFIEGSNVTLAISDDPGSNEIDISIAASGITDHGSLSGLGDYDHDQYLRKNGGNDVTGNLLPDATANLRDLGSPTRKWDDVYAQDLRPDRVWMGGTLDMNDHLIDDVDDIQAYDASGIRCRDSTSASKILLATSALAFAAYANGSMGSNKLTNVSDPSSAQDAATKNYVDTALPISHGASSHTDRTRTFFVAPHLYTDGDTNYLGALLDPTVVEYVSYRFALPEDFVSLTSVKVVWSVMSGSTSTTQVVFDVGVYFGTPPQTFYNHSATDPNNVLTVPQFDSGDMWVFTTDSSLWTGIVQGDVVLLYVERDADHSSDTNTKDVVVMGLIVEYTADM